MPEELNPEAAGIATGKGVSVIDSMFRLHLSLLEKDPAAHHRLPLSRHLPAPVESALRWVIARQLFQSIPVSLRRIGEP